MYTYAVIIFSCYKGSSLVDSYDCFSLVAVPSGCSQYDFNISKLPPTFVSLCFGSDRHFYVNTTVAFFKLLSQQLIQR